MYGEYRAHQLSFIPNISPRHTAKFKQTKIFTAWFLQQRSQIAITTSETISKPPKKTPNPEILASAIIVISSSFLLKEKGIFKTGDWPLSRVKLSTLENNERKVVFRFDTGNGEFAVIISTLPSPVNGYVNEPCLIMFVIYVGPPAHTTTTNTRQR